jgi:methylmalonyl-CoA/ethylmalonyl-CoA epimerase
MELHGEAFYASPDACATEVTRYNLGVPEPASREARPVSTPTRPPAFADQPSPGQIPGFICVDHVAIAVRPGDLEAQVRAFALLGFTEIHREEVLGGDQVREVLLRVGDGPNLIQLLAPLTPASPVQKLIDRNGGRGGLAHVAFRVADIQRAFADMTAKGFHVIDRAPRKGSRGTTVFFVHPRSRDDAPFGFLVEVVQEG